MYYDIVESGCRIRKLRTAGGMTRQDLADAVGLSLDALRKIENGNNGAKIDTLVAFSELFHVSLDYLVCGQGTGIKLDGLLDGLGDSEAEFIRRMAVHAVENIALLRGCSTGP